MFATCDVFINFRGEDTRKTFVSHLNAALQNSGVNTFLDDEKLRKGEELPSQLEKSIKASKISIVVLSVNYAESGWCLNELVNIMGCRATYRQVVIPIFYGVEPSDVRKQTGDFGKAFKLTARERDYLLSKWKTALTDVANLSGWDVTNFRTDGEMVKKIVEDILKRLDISLLSITEYPIGLKSHVQKITEFIDDQSNKVCIIGIWGMGGSGKTTMAKAIYNQIHRRFEGRTSFVESIREVCDNNSRGVIHLQQQLLLDVLKIKQKIHSISSGIAKIKERLRGQEAFVVLDDVTTSVQLQNLCADPKLFGLGSVLIITTRDLRLLNSLSGDHIFTMTEMDKHQSLELFCWHAFQQPNPRKGFSELTKKVVAYCGGLPLALEVLGSYLSKRTEQEWRSALSKLEKIPNDQVQQKLRISYDGLEDHTLKDIFLDICCFFIGKKRADVTEILNGCGLHADIGIAVLIERSLVKVEKNNKLQMHDLLRDMGRAIVGESSVKEPAKHSRLWFHEDVKDVLLKKSGTEIVEGLIFKLQRTQRTTFGTNAFQEMKKLRLLKLDGVVLFGDYGLISKQLRWVDWHRPTFKCIPDDFDQGNLVVFELKYSNVEQVWKEAKLLEKLKVLNLSHSKYLKSSPDFSKLPNLEKLIMKDCPSLSEVHSSVGDLKNLLLINLSDCPSLATFPKEIYQLMSVETLIISGCSKIDKLEEDILQMESLTTLIAANTGVKQVPFSIARLKSIGYISLCGYKGLSCDVFPSLLLSWMLPTINSLPRVCPFGGNSLSLVSLDVVESENMGYQSPMLAVLSKLRCVWIQCHSENQLTQELRRFIDDLYDVNFTELETTSHEPQTSNLSLRSLVIGMGSSKIVMDTLGKSLAQGLSTNDSSASFLPGDKYPSRLAYSCEGPSVCFQVPEDSDCCMKGITLCVLYSSKLENLATECIISVFIINYTKFTIQIYNRDTVMSFNDEDWQGVISNLGVGDNVEIFVAIGHGLTVKETTVYLLYDESNDMEVEPSTEVKMEPIPEVEVQPSPHAKVESSPELEAQAPLDVKIEPSLVVKNEPLPKANTKKFTRLAKRLGKCLCLNQK
nr:nodulation protein [Melilotus officinalis]